MTKNKVRNKEQIVTALQRIFVENKIEEKVGLPVDIVTFRSMDSQFRKNIEKEMTAI